MAENGEEVGDELSLHRYAINDSNEYADSFERVEHVTGGVVDDVVSIDGGELSPFPDSLPSLAEKEGWFETESNSDLKLAGS